jgi:hypothetical protein
MPAAASSKTASANNVLYVKFKPDSVLTVSRQRFDTLTQHFGQDATFVTHFALARLYEDVQRGQLNTAKQLLPAIAEGARPPTDAEWGMLSDISAKAMRGKTFRATQTIEDAWGLS